MHIYSKVSPSVFIRAYFQESVHWTCFSQNLTNQTAHTTIQLSPVGFDKKVKQMLKYFIWNLERAMSSMFTPKQLQWCYGQVTVHVMGFSAQVTMDFVSKDLLEHSAYCNVPWTEYKVKQLGNISGAAGIFFHILTAFAKNE